MTNREKYQRAFRAVRPSHEISMEVETMTNSKRKFSKAMVSVCVAAVLVIAGATAAYAMDFGGFRQAVTMWVGAQRIHGEIEETSDGEFLFISDDGKEAHYGGSIGDESGERPMTMEEVVAINQMMAGPEIVDEDDGTYWLVFEEQKVDITKELTEDGVARVEMEKDGKPLYVVARVYEDGSFGVSCSEDGYDD